TNLTCDLNLTGPIHGTGGLLFGGTGQIQITGNNQFSGTNRAACALLELNSPAGKAFAGTLEGGGGYYYNDPNKPSRFNIGATNAIAEVRWLRPYQITGAELTLFSNGLVNLNDNNEDFGAVTFNGGEVDSGTGQFAIYAPLTVNPAPTSAIINGYLGLPA